MARRTKKGVTVNINMKPKRSKKRGSRKRSGSKGILGSIANLPIIKSLV